MRASSATAGGWYSPVVTPSSASEIPSITSFTDSATTTAATAEPASVSRSTGTEPTRSVKKPAGSAISPNARADTFARMPNSNRPLPNSASIRRSNAA